MSELKIGQCPYCLGGLTDGHFCGPGHLITTLQASLDQAREEIRHFNLGSIMSHLDYTRLVEWIKDPERKIADIAFTSGMARDAARAVEQSGILGKPTWESDWQIAQEYIKSQHEKLAAEHENFLAVHRDNMFAATRIAELKAELAHAEKEWKDSHELLLKALKQVSEGANYCLHCLAKLERPLPIQKELAAQFALLEEAKDYLADAIVCMEECESNHLVVPEIRKFYERLVSSSPAPGEGK